MESRGGQIDPIHPPFVRHFAASLAPNGNARPPTRAEANMLIAAKIVRVDPAERLPVIAHLSALQAIGWRCVDVPTLRLEFLARASQSQRQDIDGTWPRSCRKQIGVGPTLEIASKALRYLLPAAARKSH
jgi:hypothetical protein